jgi:two-component system, OmpR family, sensor histidine kinase CiaH
MQKLYKQFAELVTRWRVSRKIDEFFVARIRLTFYYSITAIIILGGSSIIAYNAILSNFTESISERVLAPDLSLAIIADARDILFDRFLTIDLLILILVILLGFLLTHKTLQPIKSNMEKQKRFIADASHELRTPTAVVISGLEVALSNKKLDFLLAKKTLENTLDEMREFSKFSNYLLDISKNEAHLKMDYKSIDINALAKSIIGKSRNLASVKKINFETRMLNSPVIVKGNEIELSRVFYNILDNAIKYTPADGTVIMSDKVSSGKYVLTISDNGGGISKDIIDKVFEPFFRGETSRNTDGAGLGLTLSKRIIENHKGTISIKSQVNTGTEVIISLPVYS